MKKLIPGLMSALLTLTLTAQTQSDPGTKPSTSGSGSANTNAPGMIRRAELLSMSATVEDIDQSKRELTLKDEEGNTAKVKVGQDVQNFDQLKKGDQINVKYYQSIALSLRKPGDPAPTGREEITAQPGRGQQPGGMALETMQASATVTDVNYDTRTVTLKGEDGKTFKVKAGNRIQNLERIKKGDQVVARFTEGMAISITPPQK